MSIFSKVISIITNPFVLATTSTFLVAIGVYKGYQKCCRRKNPDPITTAFNLTAEDIMAGEGISNLQAAITSQQSTHLGQLGQSGMDRADEKRSNGFLDFTTSLLRRRANTVGHNVAETSAARSL